MDTSKEILYFDRLGLKGLSTPMEIQTQSALEGNRAVITCT